MAPPLLPTTRLYACPACREHIKSDDSACPHCGAELRGEGWAARAASAVLVSLALSGCPDTDKTTASTTVEPEYGVATTDNTSGTGSGSTGSSDSSGSGSASASTSAGPTTAEPDYGVPVTTSGEPEYGVPATTSGTTTGTTSASSTTVGEPEYGVPQTSGGPEPDYGVPGTT